MKLIYPKIFKITSEQFTNAVKTESRHKLGIFEEVFARACKVTLSCRCRKDCTIKYVEGVEQNP